MIFTFNLFMFINNINPDIATIGPFSIRFYGLVYALGFLLMNYVLVKVAKSKKIKNLTGDRASDLLLGGMISGLVGARVMQVFAELPFYLENPFEILAFWHGGLYFQGGLIAAITFIFWYSKKYKIKFLQVTDVVAVFMPLIIGFGRIANYINSEHVGFITNVPWCVVFQKVDNFCRHPAQIYQALTQFLLFGILYLLSKKTKKTGIISWSFVMGYGILRFITDFYRTDMPRIFIGLTITQFINLGMFGLGLYLLIRKVKNK